MGGKHSKVLVGEHYSTRVDGNGEVEGEEERIGFETWVAEETAGVFVMGPWTITGKDLLVHTGPSRSTEHTPYFTFYDTLQEGGEKDGEAPEIDLYVDHGNKVGGPEGIENLAALTQRTLVSSRRNAIVSTPEGKTLAFVQKVKSKVYCIGVSREMKETMKEGDARGHIAITLLYNVLFSESTPGTPKKVPSTKETRGLHSKPRNRARSRRSRRKV